MNNEAKKSDTQSAGFQYLSPLSLIRAAREAHPAFKYAIAAAGLAALVAVVTRYGASPATLVFGAIILVVLMVLFLVFSEAALVARAKLSTPALVLVWCFLTLSILTALFLFTSSFFDFPLPVRSVLIRQFSTEGSMVKARFTGTVFSHEGGVDLTHQGTVTLTISGGVVSGEYTNDAGDAGTLTGTLSGNSLDLKLISSKVVGECIMRGTLTPDGRLSAIYNCSDFEQAKVELRRTKD